MELMCQTASTEGGKGWRDFFSGAMDARVNDDDDDISDTFSNYSDASARDVYAAMPNNMRGQGRAPPNSVRGPATDNMSDIFTITGVPTSNRYVMEDPDRGLFTFKIDHRGSTHRVKCLPDKYALFCNSVAEKTGVPESDMILKYVDGEGDIITVSGDSGLKESVEFARQANMTTLKLTVHNKNGDGFGDFIMRPSRKRNMLLGGTAATGILAAVVAFSMGWLGKKK